MIFTRRSTLERRGRKVISNLKGKFRKMNKGQLAVYAGLTVAGIVALPMLVAAAPKLISAMPKRW